LREFVFGAVAKEYDLFCISNGKSLIYLMDMKLDDGLSLHDLYYSYFDTLGDDVTDGGFISHLQIHFQAMPSLPSNQGGCWIMKKLDTWGRKKRPPFAQG
jgi:hypothetical protein